MKNQMSHSNSGPIDEALKALRAAGAVVVRKTEFQLKVEGFNFYPNKGTIYRDGNAGAHERRGLQAFIDLLRQEGLAGPRNSAQQAGSAEAEALTINLGVLRS